MCKALVVSTVALAALAVGGAAPALAAPVPGGSAAPAGQAFGVGLHLLGSSARAGASVSFQMEVPDGSTHLVVSSKALADVRMTDGRGGTARVADVPDGGYEISLTGTGPDGAALRATADLDVKAEGPARKGVSASTMKLSADFGRPGDKVVATVKTGEKSAFVKSDAFGGQVNLKSDGHGTWTGTAVVVKDVKSGYYGVHAFAGGTEFDTVKFSTEGGGGTAAVKLRPQPLKPSEHKKPKGSVNTGGTPAGYGFENSDA